MFKKWNFNNVFASNPLQQLGKIAQLRPLKAALFTGINAAIALTTYYVNVYIPLPLNNAIIYASASLSASVAGLLVAEYARLIPFIIRRNVNKTKVRMGDINNERGDKLLAKVSMHDDLPVVQLLVTDPYEQGQALARAMPEASIDAFNQYYNIISSMINVFHSLQRSIPFRNVKTIEYPEKDGGIKGYAERQIKNFNFPNSVKQRYSGFVDEINKYIAELNGRFVLQMDYLTLEGMLILMGTPDIFKMLACSAHIVRLDKEMVLGRTLDWYGAGSVADHTVGIIYPVANEEKGKVKGWFSISFAPGLPSLSGSNGYISVTLNEATTQITKNQFNGGLPMLVMFGKIMEECASVDDIREFLISNPPATSCILTILGSDKSAIFQILPTPEYIDASEKFSIIWLDTDSEKKYISVTNHFLDRDGAPIPDTESWIDSHKRGCNQIVALEQNRPSADVLKCVNEAVTMHSMCFHSDREAKSIVLKLKFAHCYAATAGTGCSINLTEILAKNEELRRNERLFIS
ncbi:MAG: hypothetical protein HOI53_04460 [Francisellaceae bacterium]|jgi:hypothetical protein|nr:hypothetical protein [Francisellaceae bacterium]MBT6207256.1 hypothetical protein [Francisellaceae bacterium]MBT6539818.1 hypothetical protein [Francisellaceae bacterium]